jgi:antitoxin component YwqK of YwqJK toxin-antitoxin module
MCAGYPPDDFEGVWIEHWPNGQLKFRGTYKKDGLRVGQHICFWENGVLREVSTWEQGWVTGTLIRFYEDGTRECEKEFGEHGGVTR